MTNRPPLPGTYDPRDWKCPNCKCLNFKKRKNCLSCATPQPAQARDSALPDWRSGKRDGGNNSHADWTCRPCGKFNLAHERYCKQCDRENPKWEGVVASEDGRQGRAGGHSERDGEGERVQYNSDDEEFDDFGRRKKKKAAPAPAGKAGLTEKQLRQQAALERLKNKGKPAGGGGTDGDRKRSRSRSRGRRRSRSRSR
eukprot:TRINITY_DN40024_c0_g1_i1.p1 TRINITY_DN40024_c0_g1~~TRINITY_DN40024_c0_g1_i1.p1  ORF type:complete len:198 (+),score=37.05 TRINITY_DN40024_c0_g1_i1:46-639(+)